MKLEIQIKEGRPAKDAIRLLEQDWIILRVDQILKQEAGKLNITVRELLASDRHMEKAEARKLAMRQMRELGLSCTEIASVVHRHHTTVLYALGRLNKYQPQWSEGQKKTGKQFLTNIGSYAYPVSYGTREREREQAHQHNATS